MNTLQKIFSVRSLLTLAALLLLWGCEDVVDIELDESRDLLVVEGAVQTHTDTQFVKLSRTADYFSDELPDYTAESNSDVLLFKDDDLVDVMDFNPQTKQFETVHQAEVGAFYHIEITTTEGEEYVSAPEELRNAGQPDSVYYGYQSEEEAFFQAQFQVFIDAQELEGPGDNYQWKIYINGEYQDNSDDLSFVTDEFVEGNYIKGADVYLLPEEDYDEILERDGEVIVEVHQLGITREFYRYLFKLQDQSFSGSPFDTPPAEIQSNVAKKDDPNDRALGYFYAADVYMAEPFEMTKPQE